jgi:hypothetical protein
MSRQAELTELLRTLTDGAGYHSALICTDEGLLVACTDDVPTSEELAGLVGLVDEIVQRSERDLGVDRMDEVALLDGDRGRLVVRPLTVDEQRFHLVVRLPPRATWRRNTNRVCKRAHALLGAAA